LLHGAQVRRTEVRAEDACGEGGAVVALGIVRVEPAAEDLAEPAVVLALAEAVCPSLNGSASFRLATFLEAVDAGGDLGEFGDTAEALAGLDAARVEHWRRAVADLDAQLLTVLDDGYPANLRMVHDHPPFLFVRGTIGPADDRAIAIVGTRKPSDEGVRTAGRIAGALAGRGVTVVSGLAEGIDTAAHAGALNAGGRTLAVFGTGISRLYPASNRSLARAISASGAALSQFWPDMAPSRWSFPVRNIVTSGLGVGTVVVEAGPTSGACQQAHHALRHGKRLFLLRRLVEHQPWARDLMKTPGVVAIDDVEDVLPVIEAELDLRADAVV
jgi:DNA processing protein